MTMEHLTRIQASRVKVGDRILYPGTDDFFTVEHIDPPPVDPKLGDRFNIIFSGYDRRVGFLPNALVDAWVDLGPYSPQ